jgi:hypothetical protein
MTDENRGHRLASPFSPRRPDRRRAKPKYSGEL